MRRDYIIYMEIGAKIKRLRLQLNLSQAELADRCELTKGYISQLENDLTSPSIATLGDILDALGSSFSEFFRGEKNEKVVFSENDYIEKESDGLVQNWLVPNAQKNLMEPLSVELAPHASTAEDVPHEGEEFGFVLDAAATDKTAKCPLQRAGICFAALQAAPYKTTE